MSTDDQQRTGDGSALEASALATSALEPEQLVASRERPFGRRTLTPGIRATLVALRIYAIIMVLLVAYQVIQLAHASRP
ncbi:MAG: hypothetical protein ACYDDF_03250 [Thermoplasmatota archaeon]